MKKVTNLILIASVAVSIAACNGSGGFNKSEASRQNMHKIQLAMRENVANGLGWPQSLDDVKDSIENFDQIMKNPITGDDPGYEYAPPVRSGPEYKIIILYQLRNGERNETLKVGYADGSVRLKE